MSTLAETAAAKFLEGYDCSQSVLHACHGRLNLDSNIALKIACGFGGGMGRCQEVCGALTGGIMALGLRYGRGEGDDPSRTQETYLKTQELIAAFKAKHGSLCCRDLLGGCDLRTEQGHKQFQSAGLKHSTCVPCVRTVGDLLDRML
jgi:C_GCAxxG_C_C family probable redox protein